MFYLDVPYVSHRYCKCMFQIVSSTSNICCTQVFHVASVLYLRGMFRESLGHSPGAVLRGFARLGPMDVARDASGVLRTGRARPHPGSWFPLARRGGGQGDGAASAGRGKADEGGVRVRGRTRQTGMDCSDMV
jgi:hypothetical protein